MSNMFLLFMFMFPCLSLGALPRLGGINIAGMEFGEQIDGTVANNWTAPPVNHIYRFTGQGANLIRIPLGWQFAQPTLYKALDAAYFKTYDNLVNRATSTGAYVIVDVHNYGRWNKKVIGESPGLPAATLVNLWIKLAQKYKSNSRVIFGIMNEPHDLSTANWTQTMQSVVTAIRHTGAVNNILLPGNDYSSLQSFETWYNQGLKTVKNPDGSVKNLLFDLHRYLDSDGSGTHLDCVDDRVSEIKMAFAILKKDKRQAILSETGGGPTSSCLTKVPKLLASVKNSYPSIVGFAMWSAGAFNPGFEISLTPNYDGTDAALWKVVRPYLPGQPK